jgi:hypothetical protein
MLQNWFVHKLRQKHFQFVVFLMFDTCCCNFAAISPSTDETMMGLFKRPAQKKEKRPSVHEESVAMLAGALIIYFFADLRNMAREGAISTPLAELEPPLTAEHILNAIQGNEEALAKRAISHEDLQKRLEALKTLKEHQGSFFQKMFSSKAKTVMTHFVDTKGEAL